MKLSNGTVLFERSGHLAIITLNRPDSLNAINPPLGVALREALNEVRDNDSIWVAILTGAGDRAFSAGADLRWRSENEDQVRKPRAGTGGKILSAEFACWKPVIAAVNGYAVGGGLELAIACDLIVAAERARFGLPEPRRGLMADAGGVHGLSRQLPLKLAMEMILTGQFIDARRAADIGLVNRVVDNDRLIPAATELAEAIMECSPRAVQAAKQAVVLGGQLSFEEAMVTEFSMFKRLQESGDFTEGPRAFAEKRAPRWEGT
ncbi:MAG: enoyl-CoA hydratase-related protein [Dehalococcoidia bacterium]|nr:enoyl-CoA hydratase-related protein [Dehalococcoidia bacterium]